MLPDYERKLWEFTSSGTGNRCPIYNCCYVRKDGHWCPDNNRKRLQQLLDRDRFILREYDFIGTPYPGPSHNPFELVEMVADNLLREARFQYPPVPTKLISFVVEKHSIEVSEIAMNSCHAATWLIATGANFEWLVQLRKEDPPEVKRFVLFHEAFHILAHCRVSSILQRAKISNGSFNELMADYFASYMLMPRRWINEFWPKTMNVEKMAQIFDVPKSQMLIRLKHVGCFSQY